jgi:hypothetical protein
MAGRGSAGSATLILQSLLVLLGLADGASTLVLRGVTHVEWSPPFDHVVNSYLPMLRRMGFRMNAEPKRWGARSARSRGASTGRRGCPGVGMFLVAEYEELAASFAASTR